jgi:hypothetical protein
MNPRRQNKNRKLTPFLNAVFVNPDKLESMKIGVAIVLVFRFLNMIKNKKYENGTS